MNLLSRLYSWYGKRVVWGVGGVIILLAAAGIILAVTHTPAPIVDTDEGRGVFVARVSELGGNAELGLIGTVEAIDEVRLQSEVGGRITGVRVNLGQEVSAGQTIATIENASQYASLLQAEGAYEAAVAGAASSDIGVTEAKNNAVSVYKSAYTTLNSSFLNSIDQLFANPRVQTPGLRIEGGAYVTYLNSERYAFNDVLRTLRLTAETITTASDLATRLSEMQTAIERTQRMVDAIVVQLPKQSGNENFTSAQISAFQTEFANLGQTLNSTLASVKNADETLKRASVSGTGGTVSAADASVKQALGVLRAAQAAYNKTIIKSPIAGTVNTLSVKTGDYVSASSPVAIVANNSALEITTYINEVDRDRITIGGEVTIEGGVIGTISAIAPAVDPNTKKIEVRIQTNSIDLSNGETVRIAVPALEATTVRSVDTPIIIPITALKVETDRIIVFTVSAGGLLEAHPVTEGPLLGTDIIIESGLTPDMEIVLDARGLNEGDQVTVLQ